MNDLDLVREIFAEIEARGMGGLIDRFDEFCTPDFVWIPQTSQSVAGQEHKGREGLQAWWDAFSESFDEITFIPAEHRPVAPGVVLTLGRTTACGRGSRAPLEWDFSQLHRIRCGRTFWARSWASHEEGEEAARAAA